ncbi:MAG: 4a-hydroxytetrahydrobiopterin dehydratase [Nitrososphaerales archaeon]|jgi:4a-hydroxytetrahydrobiopterin dehydratase
MTRLSDAQVDERIRKLPGWSRRGEFIAKEFQFDEFMGGIGFVDAVAAIAEELDHHPDIHVRWTTVRLEIQTHDEGGVTLLDVGLASEIEKRLGKLKRRAAPSPPRHASTTTTKNR